MAGAVAVRPTDTMGRTTFPATRAHSNRSRLTSRYRICYCTEVVRSSSGEVLQGICSLHGCQGNGASGVNV
jgi:hypothetical protein